jgi:hypothetical protein
MITDTVSIGWWHITHLDTTTTYMSQCYFSNYNLSPYSRQNGLQRVRKQLQDRPKLFTCINLETRTKEEINRDSAYTVSIPLQEYPD